MHTFNWKFIMIIGRPQLELDKYSNYENDMWVRYTYSLKINQINDLIKSVFILSGGRKNQLALDAGCGSGVYSILLAESVYDVVATNIGEEEIKKANEWARIKTVQGNIESRVVNIRNINSYDSSFNFIICNEVLVHLDNPVEVTQELHRVFVVGGIAIKSMLDTASALNCLQLISRNNRLKVISRKLSLNEDQLQHDRFRVGNIKEMSRNIGFQIKYQCSTHMIPFFQNFDNLLKSLIGERTSSLKNDHILSNMPLLKNMGFNYIILGAKIVNNFY